MSLTQGEINRAAKRIIESRLEAGFEFSDVYEDDLVIEAELSDDEMESIFDAMHENIKITVEVVA